MADFVDRPFTTGGTFGASDANAFSDEIEEQENQIAVLTTQNADDISRAVIQVTGTVTISNAATTDYLVLLRSGAVPTMPSAVGNLNRYTIKNCHTAAISLAFQAGENADGSSPIVLYPNNSVDLVSDPTTSTWRII